MPRVPNPRDEQPLADLRFAVVGAGRLGASLALAMRAKGARLVGYTCHTAEGRARAQRFLGLDAASNLEELAGRSADLYLITVPDGALGAVAAQLAVLIARRDALVVHCSGANSVHELDDCASAGAATLAFHPLQTFSEPLTGSTRFVGTAVAVTPPDGERGNAAQEFGFALAEALGAKAFLLADEDKVLYHAAACVASNYLVTLEHLAKRMFVESGMPEDKALDYFMPLVRGAIDNLSLQGTIAALTGPLSRGDDATIVSHLGNLAERLPDLLPAYRAMGLATLELVSARKEVNTEQISRLQALLAQPDSNDQEDHNEGQLGGPFHV